MNRKGVRALRTPDPDSTNFVKLSNVLDLSKDVPFTLPQLKAGVEKCFGTRVDLQSRPFEEMRAAAVARFLQDNEFRKCTYEIAKPWVRGRPGQYKGKEEACEDSIEVTETRAPFSLREMLQAYRASLWDEGIEPPTKRDFTAADWVDLRNILCRELRNDRGYRILLYEKGSPWIPSTKRSSPSSSAALSTKRSSAKSSLVPMSDVSKGKSQANRSNSSSDNGDPQSIPWCQRKKCAFGSDNNNITLQAALRLWFQVHDRDTWLEEELDAIERIRDDMKYRSGKRVSRKEAIKEWLCEQAREDPSSSFCEAIKRAMSDSATAHLTKEEFGNLFNLSNKDFQKEIARRFAKFAPPSPNAPLEDKCNQPTSRDRVILNKFLPHQDFFRHYFTPDNPVKGTLLVQQPGTGKSCLTIGDISYAFEPAGWKVLWVTRIRLKNVPRETMFRDKCHKEVRAAFRAADNKEAFVAALDRKALSTSSWQTYAATGWSGGGKIGRPRKGTKPNQRIMSYREFGNLCSRSGRDSSTRLKELGLYDIWKDKGDILKRTVVVVDEAHNLYADDSDLSDKERLGHRLEDIEQTIWHSYATSGDSSCKVILLTATPTIQLKDGKESSVAKILNLTLKPNVVSAGSMGGRNSDGSSWPRYNGRLPTEMSRIQRDYLDSEKGKARFARIIKGVVSVYNASNQPNYFPIKTYTPPIPVTLHPTTVNKVAREGFNRVMKRRPPSKKSTTKVSRGGDGDRETNKRRSGKRSTRDRKRLSSYS